MSEMISHLDKVIIIKIKIFLPHAEVTYNDPI